MSTPSVVSKKKQERFDFARQNRRYLNLLNIAASDYAGARCCLLNGVGSGLQLGSQAIEKTMKAFIALTDKYIDTTKLSHDLNKLNNQLEALGSTANISDKKDLDRWMEFYNARYSFDRKGNEIRQLSSSSLEETNLLDKIMTHLVANTPDFPAKFQCGVYALISQKFGSRTYTVGAGFWIRAHNLPMMAQLSAVDKEIDEDLKS